MANERTFIGSAEIAYDNTKRRDQLVRAAEKAGFEVDCTEAIGVSFSGANTPVHWYIRVFWPCRLDRLEQREARQKLAKVWGM